jgi:deoxyadenosine/deoxycytidine kinase
MSFLSDRFHQLNNELRQQSLFTSNTFSDYSLSKSLIFARSNLQQDEFELFKKMYQIMMSNLPKPDLLVYLHRDVNELQKNIQKRGREYEQNISDEYLIKIQDSYFQYLKQQDLKMLVLDINNLDFVTNSEAFDKICQLIDSQHDVGVKKVIF